MSKLFEQISAYETIKAAFDKVKFSRGAAGIDKVSISDFEMNLDEHISLLRDELLNHVYQPLPLKKFTREKENGESRILHIPAVRDRIVAHAIVRILQPEFERLFHNCSYAYRPGLSAQKAIDRVERNINRGRTWCLTLDIQNFFDTIDRKLLMQRLEPHINCSSTRQLIQLLMESGNTERGLPQGIPLSPLLSNFYLHPLDDRLIRASWNVIRYSDNIVVLDQTKQSVQQAFDWAKEELQQLKLSFHPDKTGITNLEQGFTFLGYTFDKNGKHPARPALKNLGTKMTKLLGRAYELSETELRQKLDAIITGWRNYFKVSDDKQLLQQLDEHHDDIQSAIVRALVAYVSGDHQTAASIVQQSETRHIDQCDAETAFQWGVLCECIGYTSEAFDSYQTVMRLDSHNAEAAFRIGLYYVHRNKLDQAVRFLQKAVQLEPDKALYHFTLGTALKSYSLHGAARKALKRAEELNPSLKHQYKKSFVPKSENIKYSSKDINILLELFQGRKDIYAKQWIRQDGKSGYQTVRSPLTKDLWKQHLDGEHTLGFYPMHSDSTCKHLVFDLDVTRQARDDVVPAENDLDAWRDFIWIHVKKLRQQLQSLAMPYCIENSGYKGLHVWLFFNEPVPASMLVLFARKILDHVTTPPGLHWEYFPNQPHIREGALGCLVKLPFGIHKASSQRCFFLDNQGQPVYELSDAIQHIVKISRNDFETALEKLKTSHQLNKDAVTPQMQKKVDAVFSSCHVLRYLQEKAEREKRLQHMDRITLVSVLGHLGEAGRVKLHDIMKNTLNYDFRITDKWYQRTFGSPVSCPKIRLWQKDIVPAVGCYCTFKDQPGSYPSPVLHADPDFIVKLKKQQKDQKLPPKKQKPKQSQPEQKRRSDTSKKKEPGPALKQKSPAKASKPDLESIVGEYLAVMQQKKEIDEQVKHMESQLDQIVNKLGVNVLQTSIGTLRRVTIDQTQKWVLEL